MRLLARVLLAAFTLLVVAASAAPANSKFAFGIIKRTCAPWDGAAIGLTLTTEAAKCDRTPAPLPDAEYLRPAHFGG